MKLFGAVVFGRGEMGCLLVDKKWGGKHFVRLARVELLDLGLDLK